MHFDTVGYIVAKEKIHLWGRVLDLELPTRQKIKGTQKLVSPADGIGIGHSENSYQPSAFSHQLIGTEGKTQTDQELESLNLVGRLHLKKQK